MTATHGATEPAFAPNDRERDAIVGAFDCVAWLPSFSFSERLLVRLERTVAGGEHVVQACQHEQSTDPRLRALDVGGDISLLCDLVCSSANLETAGIEIEVRSDRPSRRRGRWRACRTGTRQFVGRRRVDLATDVDHERSAPRTGLGVPCRAHHQRHRRCGRLRRTPRRRHEPRTTHGGVRSSV